MKSRNIVDRQSWASWAKVHSSDSPPLRKQFTATVVGKGTDPDTGIARFEFIASTAAEDREGDTIAASGWELDNFKNNPVILWAHDSISLPIGRATSIVVRGGALRVEIEFTPADVNPDGARVAQLVDAGFLKAVSVGFIPLEWTPRPDGGFDFEKAELLEVSVVAVPANPEALLAAGLSSGMSVSRATLAALLEKVMDGETVELDDADYIEIDDDDTMLTITDDGKGGFEIEVAR